MINRLGSWGKTYMGSCFTNEEIVLINNLLYIDNLGGPDGTFVSEKYQHKAVSEYVENVFSNYGKIDDDREYSSGVTGAEYRQIIEAIRRNEHILGLIIMESHIESRQAGGSKSVFFYDPTSNEALIVFKGTESPAEWMDNVQGLCQVPTEYQENALNWYRSLDLSPYAVRTVSGHSKGGNKAKYITIMDESVDNCFSFDGQGFSDEFIKKYSDEIRRSEGKITNIIAESDFVNILLNDVGKKFFYLATNFGRMGFAENHCANAILFFDEDNNVSIWQAPRGQDKKMADVDVMLNSFIRSRDMHSREGVAAMLGNVIVNAVSSNTEGLIEVLSDPELSDSAADLIAFILRYKEEKPEMVQSIRTILSQNGFNTGMLGIIDFVTNHEVFLELIGESPDNIISILELNDAPGSVTELLSKHMELFGLMVKIARRMRRIDPTAYHGEDITPDDMQGLQGATINKPARRRLVLQIVVFIAILIIIAITAYMVATRTVPAGSP